MIEAMNGWFATKKIDGATWAISEYGHWEEPNGLPIPDGKTQENFTQTPSHKTTAMSSYLYPNHETK